VTLDSDGDGLKDWEESLWGTDPNVPDTDGDGTPDGDEVVNSRNPLIAGPEDLIDSTTVGILGAPSAGLDGKLSYTDQFTRTIFGSIISAKESGQVFNTGSEAEQMIGGFLSTYQSPAQLVYNYSQVKATTDNSSDSLKRYGNAAGSALVDIKNIGNKDIDAATTLLQTENEDDAEKIRMFADQYAQIAETLSKTSVPSQLIPLHLPFINAIAGLSNALHDMEKLISDPLIGVSGLSKYKKSVEALSKSVRDLNTFFTTRNIQFETSEPGYVISLPL